MNLEKLAKIKKLAESGIGGEREAALEAYNRLKALYNLTDQDIEKSEMKEYSFRYRTSLEHKLITQIIFSVCGDITTYINKHYKEVICECTAYEYEEIKLCYEIYKKALAEHLEDSYVAFIIANEIFPGDDVRVPAKKEKKELTDRQKRALKISRMVDKTELPRALIEEG